MEGSSHEKKDATAAVAKFDEMDKKDDYGDNLARLVKEMELDSSKMKEASEAVTWFDELGEKDGNNIIRAIEHNAHDLVNYFQKVKVIFAKSAATRKSFDKLWAAHREKTLQVIREEMAEREDHLPQGEDDEAKREDHLPQGEDDDKEEAN